MVPPAAFVQYGQRVRGRVRKFQGNWGFLISDEFEGDLFVGLKLNPHIKHLTAEEHVEFKVVANGSKCEAADVTVLYGGLDDGFRGQRFTGRVKSFRGNWGFLISDMIPGDIFVGLKSNPGLIGLHQDEQVEFEVVIDPRGKQEAVHVKSLSAAANAAASNIVFTTGGTGARAEVGHLLGQKLLGKVKSFKENWGFIISDSFEGDLFLHTRSNRDMPTLRADDIVEFVVDQDAQATGNYHAIEVALLKREPQDLVGRRLVGWVKSFRGNWGFLNSDHIDGDVFVGLNGNPHLSPVGLDQGETVEFELSVNTKSSRGVEAVNVNRRAVQPHMQPQFIPGVGAVQVGGRGPVGQMGAPPPQMGAPPPQVSNGNFNQFADPRNVANMVGQQCSGQVRSFKGTWGFAVSPMFDGDIFVGSKSNPHLPRELQEGDQIQFIVQAAAGISATGFEAQNVQIIGSASPFGNQVPLQTQQGASMRDQSRTPRGFSGGPRSPGNFVGSNITGWIKSFKGTWGFVNSTSFDGDLFLGAKGNPSLPPEVMEGHPVQFEVAEMAGKLEAVNARLL